MHIHSAIQSTISEFLRVTDWKKSKNVHPGEILKLDFLDEMQISSYMLAKAIGVDQTVGRVLLRWQKQ